MTGTRRMARFVLRRDQIRLPAWVLGTAGFTVLTAMSFPGLYPEEADRAARAALMGNPSAIALGGPQIGVDDYTFGAMMTNEMLGWVALAVALMSILTVVRHTRTDEELGRADLMLSNIVGERALLAAPLVVVALATAALGLLVAVGLGAVGLEGMAWSGSLLFGAVLTGVGLVFASLTAVVVQLTTHARTATGLASLALGVAYGLRALGDASGHDWLSWLSPIGWAQRAEPYVGNRWWLLVIPLVVSAVLVTAAFALRGARDLGAGLRQPRPGPGYAGPTLSGPGGLAVRLHRGSVIGWAASFLVFGLVYGSLVSEVETFADEMAAVQEVLGGIGAGTVIDGFLALLVSLLAMVASVLAALLALRAQGEEESGHAEGLLSAPVSRTRWVSSHALSRPSAPRWRCSPARSAPASAAPSPRASPGCSSTSSSAAWCRSLRCSWSSASR